MSRSLLSVIKMPASLLVDGTLPEAILDDNRLI